MPPWAYTHGGAVVGAGAAYCILACALAAVRAGGASGCGCSGAGLFPLTALEGTDVLERLRRAGCVVRPLASRALAKSHSARAPLE